MTLDFLARQKAQLVALLQNQSETSFSLVQGAFLAPDYAHGLNKVLNHSGVMWPATWGCCHPGKDWTASWQNVQCSCVGVEHWKGAAHTACCVVESHAWRSLIFCRRYQCYRRVGMRLPPCLETELKSAPVGNDFLLLFV